MRVVIQNRGEVIERFGAISVDIEHEDMSAAINIHLTFEDVDGELPVYETIRVYELNISVEV